MKERLGLKIVKREKVSLKNTEAQKFVYESVTQLSFRHQEEDDAHLYRREIATFAKTFLE